ncbi:hypothetical protein OG548_30260 [Streptomyces sp. NBC_01356]|uniref:hypothetical protein n=1 Tax=Streptomyces sp. NBC_01356 TaxID=2903836 RepID=UPI002E347A00|nr:hypothetical protein [Streptomyces sp. NBC_01356]
MRGSVLHFGAVLLGEPLERHRPGDAVCRIADVAAAGRGTLPVGIGVGRLDAEGAVDVLRASRPSALSAFSTRRTSAS